MLLTALLLTLAARTDDPPVDYARDIKPLIARHCVVCHGANKPRGDLRLDTAKAALQGNAVGPALVPGAPDESALYLALIGQGDSERMPLKRPPLDPADIKRVHDWINQGAHAPDDETPSPPPDESDHWSFRPIVRPRLPVVSDPEWCRNAIDRFVLARLDQEKLTPAAEADRATLIRRLSLDLIGLPPTLQEVADFVGDARPDAYERAVDRLLASPHYGERWAKPWLDLARYADSNGYSIDAPRSIWPYRDWVIDAFNRDLPYDQFGTLQLAGDLQPDPPVDALVATGFHRNTPINQEGGIDREQFRVESIIDRVNTTSSVFLGLTIACAQCHDHKYDPVSQKEYYQLFAFFNNVDEPEIPVAAPELVAQRDAIDREAKAYVQKLWDTETTLRDQAHAWELALDMAGRQKQSQEVREAFDVPFEKRPDDKQRTVFEAFLEQAPAASSHKAALDSILSRAPKLPRTMIVRERSNDPRQTRLLTQGDFTRPAEPVAPGTLHVLPPLEHTTESATRADLARWLFHAGHPLTARVAVNRAWQDHFGRGLVETENDFGTQGAPPSHPDLLDWLASEFIAQGFRLKDLHRLIVTSATYRQSSAARADLTSRDPQNRWLARQNRLRLEAELIRDSALLASGALTRTIGGPSVFPPQPDGVMTLGQMRRDWVAETGPNRYRRGLYTFLWRATPHPQLTTFDAPDPSRACTRRERSNTPLQALILLNDQAFMECAQKLADQALAADFNADADRISWMFQTCLARPPQPDELARLQVLLAEARASADPKLANNTAWIAVARVLLNLDEFLNRE